MVEEADVPPEVLDSTTEVALTTQEVDSKAATEKMDSLRKQLRLATVLTESNSLPEPAALTGVPKFTAKELPALENLANHPDFKEQSHYTYAEEHKKTEERKEFVDNKDRRGSRGWDRDFKWVKVQTTEWVNKEGQAPQLANEALNSGAFTASVKTTTTQLQTREQLDKEKYLVEAMARLRMSTVKREKEADSLKEALQEWAEDAKILVELDNEESPFSIVSKIEEEEEAKEHPEITSFSFSTRIDGAEYAITVEVANDEEVRVKSLPALRGIEEKITDILATSVLLDAVTWFFWNMARAN